MPPSGFGHLSDVQRGHYLEEHDLSLVRGHIVKRAVIRTLGLDETWRQLGEILQAKQTATGVRVR